MTRESLFETVGELMEVLNEKKVTIEDAENIAETFNMMVKNAGAKDIEDYKNKSSVFFCSPLER